MRFIQTVRLAETGHFGDSGWPEFHFKLLAFALANGFRPALHNAAVATVNGAAGVDVNNLKWTFGQSESSKCPDSASLTVWINRKRLIPTGTASAHEPIGDISAGSSGFVPTSDDDGTVELGPDDRTERQLS